MKQELLTIDFLIFLATAVLKIINALVVCRPSVRRIFPRFAVYSAVDAVMFVALYYIATNLSHATYFYSYYVYVLILMTMTVCCLYEIMADLFQPFTGLPQGLLSRTLTFVIVATGISIAMVWIFATHVAPDNWRDTRHISQNLQIANSMLAGLCALALWIIVFYSREMGAAWMNHTSAIALGFAVALSSDLLASAVVGSTKNLALASQFRRFDQLGYMAALFIWTFALARKEPAVEPLDQTGTEQVAAFVNKLELVTGQLSLSAFARLGEVFVGKRESGRL